MTIDPHPWATELDSLWAEVWTRLSRGVRDRRAPARHPTFATVSPDGWPEARTVVLRGADPVNAMLEVHTDLRSAKVAALRVNPRAALHVWDAAAQLQTRVEAQVTLLTGADVAEIWARVPDPSRQSYGTTPAPGQPIAASLDYDKTPDQATFAVLRCQVEAVDAVHLGPRHRRARFERQNSFSGQWLSP